ncbi:MAG: sulfite exporter TauE/SafE family protein [Chloroflexota bacterium]|nr:MAG: sulfite exporter TauE/SafE family protein [Chloroflexota bacterium]
MTLILFILGCILILAHTAETILGFGATLIALALGAYLLPIETLVPILVILALLQSIWLVVRWRQFIYWRILLLSILPLAAVGLVIGIFSREIANENTLKMVLGGFIIIVSLAELALLFLKKGRRRPLRRYYSLPLLIGGGIFHGLFATGGPPIVYYASRRFKAQQTIRATLSMLWLILNVGLIAGFLIAGQMDLAILKMTAFVLPGFVIGVIVGSIIRVKDFWFKVLIYIVLFLSGLFLLIQI